MRVLSVSVLLVILSLQATVDSFLLDGPCSTLPEFKYFNKLLDRNNCESVTEAAAALHDLFKAQSDDPHREECMKDAIMRLGERYRHESWDRDICTCTGTLPSVTIDNHDHAFRECERDHQFNEAYTQFFHGGRGPGPHDQQAKCQTHHFLWEHLKEIRNHGNTNCQSTLIDYFVPRDGDAAHGCNCTLAPDPCLKHDSYVQLLIWGKTRQCVGVNQVWQHLNTLAVNDDNCRVKITETLSDMYSKQPSIPDGCECTGSPTRHQIKHAPGIHHDECEWESDPYAALVRKLITRAATCHTQHFVWSSLYNIKQEHHRDCAREFIRTAAATIDPTADTCSCMQVTTPVPPTTTPMTTVPATTTTTTATIATTTKAASTPIPKTTITMPTSTVPMTTTTTTTMTTTQSFQQVASIYSCDKTLLVMTIAANTTVSDSHSSQCGPETFEGSNEDLVLHFCDLGTNQTNWNRGVQVASHCADIPLYTPVATFLSDGYSYTPEVQSGVFMGCLFHHGFRMGVQQCHGPPTILYIEDTRTDHTLAGNPFNYYTII